jgi:hypothetical protein
MAKNVTVVEVDALSDIPNKDRIKYAHFKDMAWRVIVSTDIKVGDLVLFVEYDQLIPVDTAKAMMDEESYQVFHKRTYSDGYGAHRIKAMKMAGEVSYGICYSKSEVEKVAEAKKAKLKWALGEDLTELMGICEIPDSVPNREHKEKQPKGFFRKWWWILRMKYLSKFPFLWDVIGYRPTYTWPARVPKTDETRFQNLGYLTSDPKFQGMLVETTEKADGQSATFVILGDQFYIGSRSQVKWRGTVEKALKRYMISTAPDMKKNADNDFEYTAAKYEMPKVLLKLKERYPDAQKILIQAEQCGPGIQQNKLGYEDLVVNVFNMQVDENPYLSNTKIREVFAADDIKVPIVKLLEVKKFDWKTAEDFEQYARGKYDAGGNREGVVVRFIEGDYVKNAWRGMANMASFKIINPDFAVGK